MSTLNPFDLLGDVDSDDPSQLIAAAQKQKVADPAPAVKPVAKLPTKPVPPSQAVRDAKNAANAPARGGAGRGGFRGGRGGRFQDRDFSSRNENGFNGNYGGGVIVEGDGKNFEHRGGYGGAPRQSFRSGARQGGFGGNAEGDAGGEEHPSRRPYERRSGTGRGYEMKREGAGRANWGNMKDDVIATQETKEIAIGDEIEKPIGQEDGNALEGGKDNKEIAAKEEEKPEEKEMTLEEYEKIREEKRKALLAMKTEERKVTIDKELESMQLLSVKKANDEIFAKLGADKESRKKESDQEEKAKKSLSIQEFLKPAAGERGYGRGRGRGRNDRDGRVGGVFNAPPPAIGDNGQFPTLGGKN